MSYKIHVIKTKLVLGEGPHWDPKDNALYMVDITRGKLIRIDGLSYRITSITPKENSTLGFVIPVKDAKGKFVVGCNRDFCLAEWDGKLKDGEGEVPLKVLHTVDAGDRINDGKADAKGRLWAGTMGKQIESVILDLQAKFWAIEPGKPPIEKLDQVGISNGIVWSLDNKTMYYIDSLRNRVDGFDFDLETGEIESRRIVIDFKDMDLEGVPDGMTIDSEGMLWIACFMDPR